MIIKIMINGEWVLLGRAEKISLQPSDDIKFIVEAQDDELRFLREERGQETECVYSELPA